MNLSVIGINHKTAPVKVRENFSFTRKKIEESLQKLKYSYLSEGAVILSTCNRSEIYIMPAGKSVEEIKSVAFALFGAAEAEKSRYFYLLKGGEAVRHLFRVASGLDSQVLGETQILGQIKSAWRLACEYGSTCEALDRIFERALETGKRVRLETRISQGSTSIGSVAINMLEDKFNDLRERCVLIIGAGKTGTLVSTYLKERGMRGIFVANRTYWRANELAENCLGKAVDFRALPEELKRVDIVISCTLSPHIVLKKDMVVAAILAREKPLFILDLALPRDVDPGVRGINGVSLYDLDDLKSVADSNLKKKEDEAKAAEKIVERQLICHYEEAKGRRTVIASPEGAKQSLSV